MTFLDTAEQNLSAIPSFYTIGILAVLGTINLYLYKRFRSIDLVQKNAENWESLYRSEETKNVHLTSHNLELEKTILRMEGEIKALQAKVESLSHMPNFAKIYDLVTNNHQETMKQWNDVKKFMDDHIEVIQIKDRRS